MTIIKVLIINISALALTIGLLINYSIKDLDIDFELAMKRPIWGYGDDAEREEEVVDGRKIVYEYHDEIYRFDKELNKKKEYKKHFIVSGGSNTFGHGIPVDETLTRKLRESNRVNDYRLYNYSFRGWGPAAFLARLENSKDLMKVKESEGVMIFNYFSFHAYRVCGYDSFMRWDKGTSPSYRFNGRELELEGRYVTTAKFFSFLLRYPFMTFDEMHIAHSVKMPKDCERLTIEIFKKIKADYLKAFPKGKFYVTIPPFYFDYDNIHTIPIVEQLEKNNIDVYLFEKEGKELLASKNLNDYPKEYFLEDRHLNGNATAEYSRMILDYLKI